MNHRATQVSTVTWAWSIPERSGHAVVIDDAELERSRWDELEGATTVEVTYVPTEPWISKVIDGEVEDTDFTKTALGGYGLSTGAMLLGIFLFITSVLQWRGWDIDLDSKTGKISIKRFGTGR